MNQSNEKCHFSKGSKTKLHSVLLGPKPGDSVVLFSVREVLKGDGTVQSVIWIAIRHEGADRQQQCGNGQDGRPFVFQNIQADLTITVNVTVINLCPERHLIEISKHFKI